MPRKRHTLFALPQQMLSRQAEWRLTDCLAESLPQILQCRQRATRKAMPTSIALKPPVAATKLFVSFNDDDEQVRTSGTPETAAA